MFQRPYAALTSISSMFILALLFAIPAAAEDDWQLRLVGVWLDPDGRSVQADGDGNRIETQADSDFGFGFTAERRINELIGIEFGILFVGPSDFELEISSGPVSLAVQDRLELQMFGAGVNFHLTPKRAVDVYLGPFVGYALISNLSLIVDGDEVRLLVDDDLTYGAVLGFDVPINENWSFNAAARYYSLELEASSADGEADPIDLDPLALGLGFGYRF